MTGRYVKEMKEAMTNRQKKPLELYVHIPFCASKCLYCDFLSFRALRSVQEEYIMQLIREIRAQGACCREYQVTTVFIGGGTPSVIDPLLIRDLMQSLFENFHIAGDAEITIEVNPGTLLQRKLPVYRALGINRVSIGLQSANNRELQYLGRIHTFEEFLKSFQYARMSGFSNINIDLMSSIPGQTMDSWRNTLKKVTMLKPEHISAYSLIVEEGTPFFEMYGEGANACGQSPSLPDEDTENRLYHLTRSFLAEQGYGRYEISNYSRPGWECRHNIGYWTQIPYLGLGLGAASYIKGCRFANERDMDAYLSLDFSEAFRDNALSCLRGAVHHLTREEKMEEFMFLGLRMIRGVSELEFVSMFGIKLEHVYGAVMKQLIDNGLLQKKGVWISLTEWGMDVSNLVLREFLLD